MKKIIITKINPNLYSVKSEYNEFEIHLHKDKGIGIFLMLPETPGYLIKSYRHLKVEVAINYLIKKILFLI